MSVFAERVELLGWALLYQEATLLKSICIFLLYSTFLLSDF